MNLPPPTEKQARIIWFAITAFAIGVLVALFGALFWGVGWILNVLSPVLIPLAMAGILAYLLDPVVDFFARKMSRTSAIVLVFALAVLIAGAMAGTVVPRLVAETRELVEKIPSYSVRLKERVDRWMTESPLVRNIDIPFIHSPATNTIVRTNNDLPTVQPNETNTTTTATSPTPPPNALGEKILTWAAAALPDVGSWILDQLKRVASWFGVVLGLVLIPVYLFYFLREKSGITKNWTDYLPLQESKAKEEVVFIINAINDSLIVFFRGQVLVGLCSGGILTLGFLGIGLNYAFLLGAVAGLLGIIPYLGVAVSLIPAVALAAIQYGDWLHPLLVIGLFALVNLLEGFVISPKIIGDRVGLHPLTIIIAVVVGTNLLGGLLGGLLAIPLTAALRAIMFRYVWKKRGKAVAGAKR